MEHQFYPCFHLPVQPKGFIAPFTNRFLIRRISEFGIQSGTLTHQIVFARTLRDKLRNELFYLLLELTKPVPMIENKSTLHQGVLLCMFELLGRLNT